MAHAHVKNALLICIALAAMATAVAVSAYVQTNRTPIEDRFADQDLAFQGKRLKGFVLGGDGLVADWYWMQSLQYLGGKVVKSGDSFIDLENLRPLNPRLLYPYLDNATDLDPRFVTAYYYGAIVLPAIDPQLAIKLTEKGIAANPNDWRLYHYLGYIYWRLKMYERAAETYDKGSTIADAPEFMKQMAAVVRLQGGSRDAARAMYTQMSAEAATQQSRDSAELRLMQLDSLDQRDAIDKALAAFKARTGRCAVSLFEIIPMLRNFKPAGPKGLQVDQSGTIIDPTGVPYSLNVASCKSELSVESRIPRS